MRAHCAPRQPNTKPVVQAFVKDKAKDKGKCNGGKNKRSPCFNWSRTPDGCVNGPCPADIDYTCEKSGGDHHACNCKAQPGKGSWNK